MNGNIKYLERKEIERLYLQGHSVATIASRINRSLSSIYRELRRGNSKRIDKNNRIAYSAEIAELKVQKLQKEKRHIPKKYSELQLIRWRLLHPTGNKAQCSRDIGVSKTALTRRFPEIYCTSNHFYTELKKYVESLPPPMQDKLLHEEHLMSSEKIAALMCNAVARSLPEASALLEDPEVFTSVWNEYIIAEKDILQELINERT